jgi:hypothetical protein
MAMVHSPLQGEYTKRGWGALGAVSIGNASGRRSETPRSSTVLFASLNALTQRGREKVEEPG